MIECFLSEHAYYFSDGHKMHSFFQANKEDVLWSSVYNEYQRSYLMLLELLKALRKDNVKNIIIYHNSRIIEEIQCKIEPLNEWGRGALIYIRRNLLPYFVDYTFRKRSHESIIDSIVSGEQKLSTYGVEYDKRKVVDDIMKRRVQRFRNEGKRIRQQD